MNNIKLKICLSEISAFIRDKMFICQTSCCSKKLLQVKKNLQYHHSRASVCAHQMVPRGCWGADTSGWEENFFEMHIIFKSTSSWSWTRRTSSHVQVLQKSTWSQEYSKHMFKLNINIFNMKSRIFQTYVQVEVERQRDGRPRSRWVPPTWTGYYRRAPAKQNKFSLHRLRGHEHHLRTHDAFQVRHSGLHRAPRPPRCRPRDLQEYPRRWVDG